jgi:hypothetical protein
MHTQDTFSISAGIEPRRSKPQRYTVPRGTGPESKIVRQKLDGFDAAQSPVGHFIRQRHPGATRNELLSLAQLMVDQLNEHFPGQEMLRTPGRGAKRSMSLTIKWYHDNWRIVQYMIDDFVLVDENFRPISQIRLPG